MLDSPVIQSLKERQSELEIEYREKLTVYKPGYPKMQQLQGQIAEIGGDIANETSVIANSVKINFEAKVRREVKITMRIGEIREEIIALQDRSTDYQTLKREVDTNRELYDGLLQRMKEVGVAAGIGTNNISVVDPAEVPRRQHKPSLTKNLAIAIALGLFGGVLLAFLFETMDDTLKSSEQVEKRIGVPVLGYNAHRGGSRVGYRGAGGPAPCVPGPEERPRGGLPLATHVPHIRDVGRCPENDALHQLEPREGKTTSAVEYGDHLRAEREQGVGD